SDGERLLEVQKLHKARVTDARARHKHFTGEVARLDQQLRALEPVEGVDHSLRAAEEECERRARPAEEIAARATVSQSAGRWEGRPSRRKCSRRRPWPR